MPGNPFKTGRDDVHATVYRGKDRTLVAIGSWAGRTCEIVPVVDWKALGLNPDKAMLYAPPIPGFQSESAWKPSNRTSATRSGPSVARRERPSSRS